MTAPSTIDVTTTNILFEGADPVGLLPEISASRYLEALRERIGERFPKARVFIKWVPTRRSPTDVVTLPKVEGAEEVVLELAEALRHEREAWVRHDEAVRAAFAT
ncbi:MAG: hypothetical protein KC619_30515 [Myxococcales bacterium]|nr:hypothetical protein [Myxococcales bacterium]